MVSENGLMVCESGMATKKFKGSFKKSLMAELVAMRREWVIFKS